MTADFDWKVEEARQAQELADIISTVINEYGRASAATGKPAMMNAMAGALATVIGSMLASVEDPRQRKALRAAMDKAIPKAIAAAKGARYVQTVVVGSARH